MLIRDFGKVPREPKACSLAFYQPNYSGGEDTTILWSVAEMQYPTLVYWRDTGSTNLKEEVRSLRCARDAACGRRGADARA